MGYRPKNCRICGNKYVPISRNNTICPNPECKEKGRLIAQEKYRKKAEERKKKAALAKSRKPDTLAEADAKARAEGLSYGQRELRIWLEQQRMERRR